MGNEQLKSQIINSLSASSLSFSGPMFPTISGARTQEFQKETSLLCTCGGSLTEVRYKVVPVVPRHHKKRIAKKWRKRWERENRDRFLASALLGAMQKPTFWCPTCKRREGFYSAMGRNMFSVEKMSPVELGYLKWEDE